MLQVLNFIYAVTQDRETLQILTLALKWVSTGQKEMVVLTYEPAPPNLLAEYSLLLLLILQLWSKVDYWTVEAVYI